MDDGADQTAQTHCSGCGEHQLAVGKIVTQANGWKCARCVHRDSVIAPPGEQMIAVNCPTCKGGGLNCAACGNLGQVRVPISQLNVYRPTSPQVLTEG